MSGVQLQTKDTSHTPFCHICRKRVDRICVLRDISEGNPIHICENCVDELKKRFDSPEKG
jgi:tRNA uridine 5-carbamoylmethylation protein Kti12